MSIPAAYQDGLSAEGQAVSLRVEKRDLVILDANGAPLDRWPVEEVHLIGDPASGETIRIRRGYDGAARLTLEEAWDLKLMARQCPNLRRTVPAFKTYWRPIAIWGLVSVTIFIVILELLLPLAAHEIAYRMPNSWHQRIGDATLEQIKSFVALTGKKEKGDIVCRSAPGYALLADLTNRLTRGLGQPAAIQLTVLNSEIVNAAALPGGHVVLFKGLIDFAEAPEEIAETLGHEIGHVVKRHPIIGAIEDTGTSLLIGYLFGDVFGGAALAGLGQTILNSANSRDAEREADALGLDLTRRLNIDGEKAARFFDRLAKDESSIERDLAFLSTHPASAERAATLRRQLTGKVPVWSESDWQAVQQVCE